MPLSSAQLAALVETARVRQKAAAAALQPPPIPPAPKLKKVPLHLHSASLQARGARPQQASATSSQPTAPKAATPAAQPPLPAPTLLTPTAAVEPENFPTGWVLSKESWHFHRRLLQVCRRPIGNTLMVRADAARWTLHTILPRGLAAIGAGGVT